MDGSHSSTHCVHIYLLAVVDTSLSFDLLVSTLSMSYRCIILSFFLSFFLSFLRSFVSDSILVDCLSLLMFCLLMYLILSRSTGTQSRSDSSSIFPYFFISSLTRRYFLSFFFFSFACSFLFTLLLSWVALVDSRAWLAQKQTCFFGEYLPSIWYMIFLSNLSCFPPPSPY